MNPLEQLKKVLSEFSAKISEVFGSLESEKFALSFPDMYRQVNDLLEELYPEKWYWLVDLYMDNGAMFAVATQGGKLYKVQLAYSEDKLSLAGELQEVIIDYKPVSQMSFVKQEDGSVRGFLLAATTVLNRNGKFNSQQLYDNFVQHFSEYEKPYVDFFHLGKDFDMGTVDFVARDEYTLVASFVFNDSVIANAMMQAYEKHPEMWGSSISFYPLEAPRMVQVTDEITLPCYDDGWLESITILPEKDAQCLFTALVSDVKQEVNGMDQRVLEALKALAGEDEELLNQFVEKVDSVNQMVENENLIHQSSAEKVVEEISEEESSVEEKPVAEAEEEIPTETFVIEDEVISKVAEEVLNKSTITDILGKLQSELSALSKRIEEVGTEVQNIHAATMTQSKKLEKKIEALSKEEDEKRKEWMSDLPAQRRVEVSYRPRDMQNAEQKSFDEIARDTIAILED
jgi:hypothetical protein